MADTIEILSTAQWEKDARESVKRRRHALNKGGSVDIRVMKEGAVVAVLGAEKKDPKKLSDEERAEITILVNQERDIISAAKAQADRPAKNRKLKAVPKAPGAPEASAP